MWIRIRLPEEAPQARTGEDIFARASDIAWLLMIAGAVVMLAHGITHLAKRVQSRDRGARRLYPSPLNLLIVFIPALLAAYLLYDRIGATKTDLIGGPRYFWLDDDQMISMRYALNLARGEGLVWNAGGPRVEGFSNFLWVMVMTLPHLAGLPLRLTGGGVLLATSVLFVLMLFWTARLGTKLGLSPGTCWIALLLLAGNRWLIHWAASGSEVILMAWLLLIAADLLLSARRHRPAGPGTGIVLGLLALTRVDGLILLLGFMPALIVLYRARRASFWVPLLAFGLPAAHVLGRRLYYGEWMPNTYWLKAVDIPMKEAMGVFYMMFFFYFWGALCVLQLLSLRLLRHPVARWIGIVPWIGLGYVTLVGGDELGELRFIVPLLPLLALGALAACERILVRPRSALFGGRPSRGVGAGSYGWLVLALTVGTFNSLCLPFVLSELGTGRGVIEKGNVQLGLLLKENTNPDAEIAHFWAGAAPYFSERPAQDMLGKNDRHIARLRGRKGQWQPGHVKYDPAYSMGLEPDVVVTAAPEDWLDDDRRRGYFEEGYADDYPSLFAIYDDPTFKELYVPGLVPPEVNPSSHAVLVRQGTTAAEAPREWKSF